MMPPLGAIRKDFLSSQSLTEMISSSFRSQLTNLLHSPPKDEANHKVTHGLRDLASGDTLEIQPATVHCSIYHMQSIYKSKQQYVQYKAVFYVLIVKVKYERSEHDIKLSMF